MHWLSLVIISASCICSLHDHPHALGSCIQPIEVECLGKTSVQRILISRQMSSSSGLAPFGPGLAQMSLVCCDICWLQADFWSDSQLTVSSRHDTSKAAAFYQCRLCTTTGKASDGGVCQ